MMATFKMQGTLLAKQTIKGTRGDFLDLKVQEQRFDPNTGELWSDYTFSILLFNEIQRKAADNISNGSKVTISGVVASKEVSPPNGDTFHSSWLKATTIEAN